MLLFSFHFGLFPENIFDPLLQFSKLGDTYFPVFPISFHFLLFSSILIVNYLFLKPRIPIRLTDMYYVVWSRQKEMVQEVARCGFTPVPSTENVTTKTSAGFQISNSKQPDGSSAILCVNFGIRQN